MHVITVSIEVRLHLMQRTVLQDISVRLSVRLSNVRTVTKHKTLVPKFLYQMKDHIFLSRRMVGAASPFYLKIWCQDTSDPRHFGTIRLVPKCPDSSAPVPQCLSDTSVLVPNCLDLDNPFLQVTSPIIACQSLKFLVTSICDLPDVINC